jgi:hypothetical protein
MQHDSFYEKNLNTMRRCRSHLAVELERPSEENLAIRIYKAKSSLPILEAKGDAGAIPLHSRADPATEARRWTAGNTDGEEQVIFLFGFGIGYHVEELLAANDKALIIVFEPSRAIFTQALAGHDLTTVLESERVHIVLGDVPAPFDHLVSNPSITRVKFLSLRPYQALFPALSAKLKREYISWLNRRQINTATIRRFDRLWTANTFKNSEIFFSLKGIDTLKGRFQGFPAIVMCAGPSLEGDIEEVRKMLPGIVTFAVDTVLRPIMARGVVPDFVVSVDPQWVNSFILLSDPQLHGEQETLPVLVADPAVYPATLREYRGIKAVSSSVFAPGRIIERFSGPKGTVAAGGSVAVAAYDLARISGADPILLLGLDLSYSSTRTHLSGSFHEIYLLSRANRLDTLHTQMVRYIAGGEPFYTNDKSGKKVLTDRRMMLYHSWFESQAKSYPGHTINASSGGMSIDGIENIPIQDLQDQMKNQGTNKRAVVKKLRGELRDTRPDLDRVRCFLHFLNSLKQKLESIEPLARRGSSLVEAAGSSRDVKKSLSLVSEELESIDSEILSNPDATHLLSMVMQTPIVDILSKLRTEDSDKHTAIENSISLYRSIDEGAEFLLGLLAVALKQMQELLK